MSRHSMRNLLNGAQVDEPNKPDSNLLREPRAPGSRLPDTLPASHDVPGRLNRTTGSVQLGGQRPTPYHACGCT